MIQVHTQNNNNTCLNKYFILQIKYMFTYSIFGFNKNTQWNNELKTQ